MIKMAAFIWWTGEHEEFLAEKATRFTICYIEDYKQSGLIETTS